MVPTASLPSVPTASAVFDFSGRFAGREVLWHCQLATLASIAQQSQCRQQRQFIEILSIPDPEPARNAELQIRIGLNVAEIDAAVIEKTIIMIRNYKRLQIGRYEYGDSYEFALD